MTMWQETLPEVITIWAMAVAAAYGLGIGNILGSEALVLAVLALAVACLGWNAK